MPAKFIQNLAVRKEINKDLDKDIGKLTAEIETAIRNRTPVRTGNLKAHIDGRKTGYAKGEVATNVEYAEHVEYGTSRMSPRAMFRKGASDVEKKGLAIFN
jgi:HK97 gp10 family phage protein